MCGITGIVGHAFTEEQLRASVAILKHRGPDAQGIYIDADRAVGLGHARLAVIDLDTGDQPLFDPSGEVVLVCNGEIYDFERIREDLRQKGYLFATHSDSEIIIALYQEYGLDFVHHLRGEFAFLLYDKARGHLLAVRDRFGIKPLFYHASAEGYLFASEAKGLFATGLLQPRLDVEALRNILSFVMPDAIFEGVHVVPPGHLLKIDLAGEAALIPYWDVDLPPGPSAGEEVTEAQAIDTVRRQVDEAVRLRLRADVPVGVYLSGGIDSAAVAATLRALHHGDLKAFTISFPDDAGFDELHLAQAMAEKIGVEMHTVVCDHAALLENLEACLWHVEFPCDNLHGVGKFMLSKRAAQHVKVVLTGEGADEVFLGYDYFQPGKASITEQVTDRPAREPIKGPHVDAITQSVGFIPNQEMCDGFHPRRLAFYARLFHRKHRPNLARHPLEALKARIKRAQTAGRSWTRQIQYYSIKGMLAPYILTMLGDRQEMAHALEGRTPFLDHPLFEAARALPDAVKIKNGREKHVLREAMKDRVTPAIYARKKWPFSAPSLWLKKGIHADLDRLLKTYLSREAVKRAGLFDGRTLALLRFLHRTPFLSKPKRYQLNRLLMFVLTVQILETQFVQEFGNAMSRDIPAHKRDPARASRHQSHRPQDQHVAP